MGETPFGRVDDYTSFESSSDSYFAPAKRGRFEESTAQEQAHLIEILQQENIMLKQRIEDLKKQVLSMPEVTLHEKSLIG